MVSFAPTFLHHVYICRNNTVFACPIFKPSFDQIISIFIHRSWAFPMSSDLINIFLVAVPRNVLQLAIGPEEGKGLLVIALLAKSDALSLPGAKVEGLDWVVALVQIGTAHLIDKVTIIKVEVMVMWDGDWIRIVLRSPNPTMPTVLKINF